MKTLMDLNRRVREWREAFDQAFAEPPPMPGPAPLDFLGLGLAAQGLSHAVALSELASLQPLGTLEPYPGGPEALLGLVALRGAVLPLYDLRALLDLGPSERPGWLLLPRAAPLALAFERFDGHWRLPRQACLDAGAAAPHALCPQLLQHPGPQGPVQRPLIALQALCARLQAPR